MADKKNEDRNVVADFSVNHDQLVNQNDKEATQSLLSDSEKIEKISRRAGYQVSQFDTSSTSGSTDFFDAMAYGSVEAKSVTDDKQEEKKEEKKTASKPGPKPGAKAAADKAAADKKAEEEKAAKEKAEAEKAAADKNQSGKTSSNS